MPFQANATEILPYMSPLAHLIHYMSRIRLLLQRYLILYGERTTDTAGKPSNLYVSKMEMKNFLEGRSLQDLEQVEEINMKLLELENVIQARVEKTSLLGTILPLEDLRATFQLSPQAVDLIMAATSMQLDPGCARAFTHSWADFTKKQADVGFFVELLSTTQEERDVILDLFDQSHPLIRYQILILRTSTGWGTEAPLLFKRARIADRVVDFLRGKLEPNPFIFGRIAKLEKPQEDLEEALIPKTVKETLQTAIRMGYSNPAKKPRINLIGPTGCGKKTLAKALAKNINQSFLTIDLDEMPVEPLKFEAIIHEVLREAMLQNAVLYFDKGEALGDPEKSLDRLRILKDCLSWHLNLVYFSTEKHTDHFLDKLTDFIPIKVPYPSLDVQRQLWHRFLPVDMPISSGIMVRDIVKRYSLSGGSIRAAIAEVVNHAKLREKGKQIIYSDELYQAVRHQLKHRLGDLARSVSTAYDWEDLILNIKTVDKLKEILSYFNHQQFVMRDWGFGAKLIYGKGLSVLFSGPSGTGKTMAASIIAKELGMELYRIDLSQVVDKYIGETEKNLSKIFDEASRGQAVLLFDEADSLFSKRTSVKSSTDRYSNLEINYLLQRMEDFEGITILTTNLESAIDDAFKRRIRFRIKFPFPDKDDRTRLWKSMIPPEAQIDKDLNLEWLAEDYEISGGHIKNAVIRAAIFAAEQGTPISYNLLKKATDLEYEELGKVVRQGNVEE